MDVDGQLSDCAFPLLCKQVQAALQWNISLSCLLKQNVFALIICLETSSDDVLRIPYLFFVPKLINLFVSDHYTLDY